MINLLPSQDKSELVYAVRNTRLLQLGSMIAIGLFGCILLIGAGFFYLQQETISYEKSAANTKLALEDNQEKQTITRVQGISDSLNLVVDVLSQEVLFSRLLREVAETLPAGTVLQDLSLSSELSGAIDLQVGAANYDAASQVQVNIENAGDTTVFEKADLIGISCKTDPQKPSQYPCQVSLRAIFSKDASFRLLDIDKGAEQ